MKLAVTGVQSLTFMILEDPLSTALRTYQRAEASTSDDFSVTCLQSQCDPSAVASVDVNFVI